MFDDGRVRAGHDGARPAALSQLEPIGSAGAHAHAQEPMHTMRKCTTPLRPYKRRQRVRSRKNSGLRRSFLADACLKRKYQSYVAARAMHSAEDRGTAPVPDNHKHALPMQGPTNL